ncbi:MAG: hypothetical protein QOJ00_3041 [Actinomycetota bacterium]
MGTVATDVQSIVIVGTGAAGYAVAEGLHTEGFTGAVTLVGEEQGEPYDRPPLSKEVLSGAWEPSRAALIAARRVEPLHPTILTGVRAVALEVTDQRVELSDGRSLPYDAVVIATGVAPRRLEHPDVPNIRVLRTMDDALALRALLVDGGRRLLVVGGGFLGLEAAATARGLGATVTVVEPIPGPPLASRIGNEAATKLLATHRAHGVEVFTGIGVASLDVAADGTVRATLSDGTTIEADVVLVAVGSVPNTRWLEGSGLEIVNGVVCDAYCSAAPGVWAAGDVASWQHVGYERRLRLEHRTNAQEQGLAVARNIVGDPRPFTPVPYFWTYQYDVRIQVHGQIVDVDRNDIVEGAPGDDTFVQTFSFDGKVTAALGWNAARRMAEFRRQLLDAMPA